jgi:SAM-dependent methyltransferase
MAEKLQRLIAGKSMLKNIHDKLTQLLCWVKKNRQLEPKQEVVKVNLGSGLAVAPDWYNVDGHLRAFFSTWPRFVLAGLYRVIQKSKEFYSKEEYIRILKSNRFVHHDLKYGIPFADGTVDFIYASHFLEHLHRDEAEQLVRDGLRVLKPQGVFRICIPDLAYAMSLYQKGEKACSLGYFFNESRQDYYTYHRYLYDFEMLKEMLLELGFSDVVRRGFRQGLMPDIAILDNRPEETLFVEAVK